MATFKKLAESRYARLWADAAHDQVPTSRGEQPDSLGYPTLGESNAGRNRRLLTGERFGLGQAAHFLQRQRRRGPR